VSSGLHDACVLLEQLVRLDWGGVESVKDSRRVSWCGRWSIISLFVRGHWAVLGAGHHVLKVSL
jgi:hypothetical protein